MVFNPDPNKQAQKDFFIENKISLSPSISEVYSEPCQTPKMENFAKIVDRVLNTPLNLVAEKVKTQKYLGLKLDEKLNFREHLKEKLAIVNT